MGEDELVRRILDEADMAARPGQYDRLVAIANEVAALREQLTRRALDWSAQGYEQATSEVLADLRAKVEGLIDPGCMRVVGGCDCQRTRALRQVLALIEEAGR